MMGVKRMGKSRQYANMHNDERMGQRITASAEEQLDIAVFKIWQLIGKKHTIDDIAKNAESAVICKTWIILLH